MTAEAPAERNGWNDAELLDLMRRHAPQGVRPEEMLPVLRSVVATGTDPRAVVAAVQGGTMPGPILAQAADGGGERTPPSQRRRLIRRSAILLFWLLVWELADHLVDNRLILTGPVRTAQALIENVVVPEFWLISGASFGRIALGFAVAFSGGILLALVSHRFALFRDLLLPVMSVMKTVPMVSFMIMLLIWVGAQALTVWLAFLIVTPLVYLSMAAGLNAVDRRSIEMARVHRLSAVKRFLYVYRPVFMPFLVSACQVGLGMSWKAGIMAEVFATTPLSIGKEMFVAKTFLDTPALFAWTVVVMLLSLLFERVVMMLLRAAARPFGSLLGSRA